MDRGRVGRGLRRLDPAHDEPVGPEHAELVREALELVLHQGEHRVAAAGHEVVVVEERPHRLRRMPAEIVELDPLEAEAAVVASAPAKSSAHTSRTL